MHIQQSKKISTFNLMPEAGMGQGKADLILKSSTVTEYM